MFLVRIRISELEAVMSTNHRRVDRVGNHLTNHGQSGSYNQLVNRQTNHGQIDSGVYITAWKSLK